MQVLMSLLNYVYTGTQLSWLNDVYDILPPILYTILAVVGGAGSVYAIVLGVNLAKSESDDKRKAAASRMKNTIIGVEVLLVLVLFITLALPEILRAAYPENVLTDSEYENVQNNLNAMIQFFSMLK